jgi:hypothetical protein
MIQKIKEEDQEIKKLINSNTKNIVGTNSFWIHEGHHLANIMRNIDIPTFFATISAADTYNPKL